MKSRRENTSFESVILKRFFCAKDLPESFGLKRGVMATSRESSPKSLRSAFKSDASREILRPKAGLRMTAVKLAWRTIGAVSVLAFACTLPLHAQGANAGLEQSAGPTSTQQPSILSKVGIDQHLNDQLPLDLHFRDEAGKDVRLGDYFGKRPVILSLVYYRCPMLCGEVLNGITSALSVVSFDLGKDYDIVTVSIDPREKPTDAAKIKPVYLRRYNRHSPTAAQGWHFLTGQEDQIEKLAAAVGFRYVYDPRIDQYAHASGIEVVTPEGKLSQYYYGIEYSPKDLRLGLIQASQNHIGTVVDALVLYCYHYDPATGHYGAIVMRIVRLSGIATVLLLGGFIFIMVRRDVRAGKLDSGRAA
jgi:protein SCO1